MTADQKPPDVVLTVDVERPTAETAVVRPCGDVDSSTVPQVREYVTGEVGRGARHIVLDLAGVAFMGSAGLALLVEQMEAAQERSGSFRLAAVPRPVARPLAVTGLLELFEVHPDVPSALAGL